MAQLMPESKRCWMGIRATRAGRVVATLVLKGTLFDIDFAHDVLPLPSLYTRTIVRYTLKRPRFAVVRRNSANGVEKCNRCLRQVDRLRK